MASSFDQSVVIGWRDLLADHDLVTYKCEDERIKIHVEHWVDTVTPASEGGDIRGTWGQA